MEFYFATEDLHTKVVNCGVGRELARDGVGGNLDKIIQLSQAEAISDEAIRVCHVIGEAVRFEVKINDEGHFETKCSRVGCEHRT